MDSFNFSKKKKKKIKVVLFELRHLEIRVFFFFGYFNNHIAALICFPAKDS